MSYDFKGKTVEGTGAGTFVVVVKFVTAHLLRDLVNQKQILYV